MRDVVVEVSARKVRVPFECPCCANARPESELAANHTRTTGTRVVRETTRGFTFPYCVKCVNHVELWESAHTIMFGFVLSGVLLGVIAWIAVSFLAGCLLFLLALVFGFGFATRRRSLAKASCLAICVNPSAAIRYLGWSGSVSSFSCSSPEYAARFAHINARSLINVDAQLRRLLETVKLEESTDTPKAEASRPGLVAAKAAAGALPARDLVLEWVSRIEGYKGPVARRSALERALTEVTNPEQQRQLMQAASRIEVAAVLDKVDSLASVEAKKRNLQNAIDSIHADNVPDELQANELQILEARLRSLG